METVDSAAWRMLSQRLKVAEPLQGLDARWHQVIGLAGRLSPGRGRFLRQADRVMAMTRALIPLSDAGLRDCMAPLQDRFRLGRDTIDNHLLAFAIIGEVAARTVGLRPYREQIAAAISMEAGCVAEMATGEGKTLVAALPAVLAGWRGHGCHVITANAYLARRDAGLMKAVYRFCGLTVGCVTGEMEPTGRKQAYRAHVTYCTNKEAAADFLRDRLLMGSLQGLPAALLSKMVRGRGADMSRLVQRGLACAIVDEADSIFVDEAVTPLLISGESPNQDHVAAYRRAARLADGLRPSMDFRIDRPHREIHLTPAGKQRLAELAHPLGGLWAGSRRREELVVQTLAAREFFIRDKQYVVDGGKVVIVDEFTGRLMPDRTWREGIHQAIEAKEGLDINLPKETHARISFQRFFRLYGKLCGMSGTVTEARSELWQIYRLAVVSVPTHRPCRRTVMPDRVFTTAAAKWEAVVKAITEVHRTGRPVLVGTRSIRESVHLSGLLAARGVAHRLLNAVQQDSEALIIAQAGRRGQVTVSTNMAGRGTDIRLGPGVAELGGLHVIATQRAEARRIDRQLFGRCARQGDPGSAQAFVSLEDDLFRRHARLVPMAAGKRYSHHNKEISSPFWRRWINTVQSRAERVSFRARKEVLSADKWIEHQLGFASHDI
ncbi:protein translocase subunit SecA [Desulfosarcina alkanivorans]|uniref:Protein translocase subunit SecA n=1 Tax=Desulfosarcina alkanivorans TaxID=571177 RepID=A0A5K7YKR1_9BACT|nr:DEAD/DEAH box helicase [Desulfosarcina alkanivorans]BBO69408.1 protein translocase subunit SecA [Desulfosarcina alkanivorans]